MKKLLTIYFVVLVAGCNSATEEQAPAANTNNESKYRPIGMLERIDPALDAIIDSSAKAEIIAEGFEWSEGPLWVDSHKMLLISDVPRDTIFKWTEEKGKEVYLTPSGYTDTIKRGGETGSNGLILDKDGKLVLCQCGNRQMARMNASLDKPVPDYTPLANRYNGKKFNSPNDAVYSSQGDLFFTDPPYGLEKHMDDPNKQLPFQGVFKVLPRGKVVLVTDTLTRPNGIALLPGEKTLLVANSDPAKPHWYAFDIGDNDTFSNGRIFLSAADHKPGEKGLPDGMKVDKNGNVFATGPGGIWIFNKEGKVLGKFKVPESTSNVALSPDEKTLYVTNDMQVLRIKMRA